MYNAENSKKMSKKKQQIRYWLAIPGLPWQEATKKQFVCSERAAGFQGDSHEPVTGSFSNLSISGRITEHPIPKGRYKDEPEFLALLNGTKPKEVNYRQEANIDC